MTGLRTSTNRYYNSTSITCESITGQHRVRSSTHKNKLYTDCNTFHHTIHCFWRFAFSSDCVNLCGLFVSLPFRFLFPYANISLPLFVTRAPFPYLGCQKLLYNWHLESHRNFLVNQLKKKIRLRVCKILYIRSHCQIWSVIAENEIFLPTYAKQRTTYLLQDLKILL